MKNSLIRAFTGTVVDALLLKGELEKIGVSVQIRDDFNASLNAGYFSGSPSSLELYIYESDLGKAQPILQEFLNAQDPQK
jgi:hypothetical protein